MPKAPIPSTLRISNSSRRVPGASASCSAARLEPPAWRGSGTVVCQGLWGIAFDPERGDRKEIAARARADFPPSRQSALDRAPTPTRTREHKANDAPECAPPIQISAAAACAKWRCRARRDASADDERAERDEAEPERRERVAGD